MPADLDGGKSQMSGPGRETVSPLPVAHIWPHALNTPARWNRCHCLGLRRRLHSPQWLETRLSPIPDGPEGAQRGWSVIYLFSGLIWASNRRCSLAESALAEWQQRCACRLSQSPPTNHIGPNSRPETPDGFSMLVPNTQ